MLHSEQSSELLQAEVLQLFSTFTASSIILQEGPAMMGWHDAFRVRILYQLLYGGWRCSIPRGRSRPRPR
ncbi:hypothetical protein VTN02DRAFT_2186 [Thermoascus thermophilus]